MRAQLDHLDFFEVVQAHATLLLEHHDFVACGLQYQRRDVVERLRRAAAWASK